MNASLPPDWRLCRLDGVADVRLGRQRSPKNHHGTQMRPYLRAANVGWSGLLLDDVKEMNFTDEEMSVYRLQPNDVVLSEASGSPDEVGKPALWSGQIPDCAFQNTLLRVRSQGPDPRYLLYFFKYLALSRAFARRSRGVGIHHIGRAALAGWQVPVAPPKEQCRIVEILEDHLSRLDAAKDQMAKAAHEAEAWRRAALDELIWRKVDGVSRARLSDVVREKMRNGHSARASRTGEGVRTLTITAVTRSSFRDEFTKVADADRTRVGDLWLRDGDIFVQRSNTAELVGSAAIYHGPDDWAIFPDLLIRVRADGNKVLPDYVAAVMRSERAHRYYRGRARGLAGSMPKIDQAVIGSLEIPVRPLSDQSQIVRAVDEVEAVHRHLVDGIASAGRRRDGLVSSLLRAAFSGQLTRTRLERGAQELAGV